MECRSSRTDAGPIRDRANRERKHCGDWLVLGFGPAQCLHHHGRARSGHISVRAVLRVKVGSPGQAPRMRKVASRARAPERARLSGFARAHPALAKARPEGRDDGAAETRQPDRTGGRRPSFGRRRLRQKTARFPEAVCLSCRSRSSSSGSPARPCRARSRRRWRPRRSTPAAGRCWDSRGRRRRATRPSTWRRRPAA